MPSTYIVDFLCYGDIVVELKALSTLSPVDHAQAINYLRVSGLRRALLINFGARSLQFKRIVWDDPDARTRARPTTPYPCNPDSPCNPVIRVIRVICGLFSSV